MELSGLRLLDKLRPSQLEVLAANDWIAPRIFVMTASGRLKRCDVGRALEGESGEARRLDDHPISRCPNCRIYHIQAMPLPRWVAPQLSKLVEKAPTGPQWVHEIKFDGFRMAARIERGQVQLLTRSGLDWTAKYPATAAAFAKLPVKTAYIDGELCGVRADGVTSFELMQQSSDAGYGGLVHFAFDLLELNGENVARLPLLQRKERLAQLLQDPPAGVVYSEHEGGDGEAFRSAACQHGLEGVVSKRTDRPYLPGDRGAWVKSKCLNRAEFVVVGWSDPEGSRHLVGSLLLGYYDPEGRLIYAGRVGTGMSAKTLAMLHQRLEPLATSKMPLSAPPPRRSRFGGPLALSKVHWVRPELVAEITYLGWTDEPLLRHTVFVGLRDDKPAREVRREVATRP
jgi:bifunctional non-homologous end joining protein LigD